MLANLGLQKQIESYKIGEQKCTRPYFTNEHLVTIYDFTFTVVLGYTYDWNCYNFYHINLIICINIWSNLNIWNWNTSYNILKFISNFLRNKNSFHKLLITYWNVTIKIRRINSYLYLELIRLILFLWLQQSMR